MGEANKLLPEDRPAHDWYRFVLSFPPHLIRDYVQQFGLAPDATVCDPFCGAGTTLVECKKLGLNSVGLDRNPMAWFFAAARYLESDECNTAPMLDNSGMMSRTLTVGV